MGASKFVRANQWFPSLISSLIFLLCALPHAVYADDHGVTFLFPTRGLTFHYLDIINVTYLSPFPQPNLYIFCDGGGRQVDFRPAAPYNGSVLELLNFTSTTDCWFNLRPGTVAGQGANSQTFKLLNDARAATTVGLTQSSATTSSSTSTSSTATSSPSTTTTAAASSGGTGLSTGATAGIGVGVALGVILIAGAAGAFWWRRRKARKAAGPAMAERLGGDGVDGTSGGYSAYTYGQDTPGTVKSDEQKVPVLVAQPYVYHPAPTELDHTNPAAEMPGESDRRPELP